MFSWLFGMPPIIRKLRMTTWKWLQQVIQQNQSPTIEEINYNSKIAVYGKGFNHSARDAWELFQSTGVEALIAYDCSGAVLLMSTVLGGLITGSCAGAWARTRSPDRVIMVGSTAMLMGMIMVGLAIGNGCG